MTSNAPIFQATWPVMTSKARFWLCSLVLACAGQIACAPGSHAESLRDALRAAYEYNPQLDAERARLRATDENVARARSGYRPTLIGEASVTGAQIDSDPKTVNDGGRTTSTVELNVTQPVFRGFRTTNAVNRAEAQVHAGRQTLRSVESTTLFSAASAYMDVIRDQAILRLRERNVSVLSRELDAAQARRAVREVTLTDVAQARSRRALAVSQADVAKADLRIARATFRQIIGHAPVKLRSPSHRVPKLPRSLNDALSISDRESPAIIASLYQEQAARYSVDEVWGELLPTVNLEANYAHQTDPSQLIDSTDSASITGRVTVPFYRGGDVHARVRQAKHTHVSRLQEIEQTRTQVVSGVTAAWSRLVAARAQLNSARVQVSATRTALEGVREEEKVGQRTLLDVLNAEQEYLDAQVSRVITRRDLIVASYALLNSIGRLTAEWVDEIPEVYDPQIHYEETRDRWIGVTITQREVLEEPLAVVDLQPSLIDDSIPSGDSPGQVIDLFKQTLK